MTLPKPTEYRLGIGNLVGRQASSFLDLVGSFDYRCGMNITRRVGVFFSLLTVLELSGCATETPDNYTEHPGNEGDGSFTIGPEYKLDPDVTDRGNLNGNGLVPPRFPGFPRAGLAAPEVMR